MGRAEARGDQGARSTSTRRMRVGWLAVVAVAVAGCAGAASSAQPAGPVGTSRAGPPGVTTTTTTTSPSPQPPTAQAQVAVSVQRPFVSPISAGNKPVPVPDETNGEMAAARLVNVAPGCMVERAAAPSLGLLFARARARGTALGARDCYRPLAGQVAVGQAWTGAGNSACAAPVVTTPSGPPKGTSMHGWGRAVDFSAPGAAFSFDSIGYHFLEAEAGRFGWNHPGWAQPGGSACPEAWHWEWVGDGGALQASAVAADIVAVVAGADGRGYSLVTGLGAVTNLGPSSVPDQTGIDPLAWLVVAAARTPDGRGLWLVSAEGGVFTLGDARFFGSTPMKSPAQPVVGIAATPRGDGYWLVSTDGTIAAFGAARSHGSPVSSSLTRPVVGIAATPTGLGYWLVTADGTVLAHGDATLFRASFDLKRTDAAVAIAATPSGRGYWVAYADGGVAAFGDAPSLGPVPVTGLHQPVVGITPTPTGHGYWLVSADGGVFTYGDATYLGRR